MIKTVFASMLALSTLASCSTKAVEEVPPADQVMCIEDAKQCPDGTWVGRSGPNCEFKCP
jgi:predicted small lipoprotein YifL